MKKITSILFLLVSIHAQSETNVFEYDEKLETQCFKETKNLGCHNKRNEEDATCVKSKQTKLSKECRSLFEEKKKQ